MKKTYEEIVKEVDKDFESYTLEDKVQAINVYSIDKNTNISTYSLSKEEYEKYFNDIRYNREMYLRSITVPSKNHKVKIIDILEDDIEKLVPIDREEAKTLLDRDVVIGYYSELSYHGSSAGDYVFHEVNNYDKFREEAARFRWTWYISPNCNVKDKILDEYEKSKSSVINDRELLVEKLTEMLMDFEMQSNSYQTDVYAYYNCDTHTVELDTFVNVGGNSWLDDDHYTIYVDKEHHYDEFDAFGDIGGLLAYATNYDEEKGKKVLEDIKRKLAEENDEDIDDIEVEFWDVKNHIKENDELHDTLLELYYKEEILSRREEYEQQADVIISEFEDRLIEEKLKVELLDLAESEGLSR